MNLDVISQAASVVHLTPLGGFHEDGGTIVLLGPKEPGFWTYVSQRPEFKLHSADPLDSWSNWAITALGYVLGAEALFPFGGPPHHPFHTWATKSGEAWASPVGLLVHSYAGLLVSYRGALRFDTVLDLQPPQTSPCESCADKPCLTACPVGALTSDGYDVPQCKAHIDVDPGCRRGCRVRQACPISKRYPRHPAQTAFHMESFHPSCQDA